MLGFIQSLNNHSDTSFVVRIFSIVAIKKADPLLLVFARQPIPHKILDLSNIHKLHIIDMTILLPLDDHIGRHAFVTHSFGVGFMASAAFVDLVADSGGRETVVAFNLGGVHSFAFEFALFKPVVKRNVGCV